MEIKEIVRRAYSKVFQDVLPILGRLLQQNGMVLMFHSVGGEKDEFNITVDQFENILKRLKEINVVRLEEWEEQKDFVCLTFDDVPVSFYYNAFPLLQQYNLPFTIFVSCSLLDTEGYITTGMLKEMSASELCTVGSHGWKHDFFYKFSLKGARQDLESSKKHLESLIGMSVELYAFPYGSFYACGLKHKHLVSDYYKYGFGTVAVPITNPSLLPKYFLPRINVTEVNYKSVITNTK